MQVKNGQANIYNGLNVSGSTTVTGTTTITGSSIGSPTLYVTNGGVQFGSTTGLVWDATNNRLGIGTNSPSYPLDVSGVIRTSTSIYMTGGSAGSALTNTGGGDWKLWLYGNYGVRMTLSNTANTSTGHIITSENSKDIGTYTTSRPLITFSQNVYAAITASNQTQYNILVQGTMNYASMSSINYSSLLIKHTYTNLTGSGNLAKGVVIDATFTNSSASLFNAIEAVQGNVLLNMQNGRTLIGATTSSGYQLDVNNIDSPSGSLRVSGSTALIGSGSTILSIDGSSGRLFSVDDSLSGSLFSVNTAAGLPVMEAFSDNTVRIGQYGTRALFVSKSAVGIGTETPNKTLTVSGSVILGNSTTPHGNDATNNVTINGILSLKSGYLRVDGTNVVNLSNSSFTVEAGVTFISNGISGYNSSDFTIKSNSTSYGVNLNLLTNTYLRVSPTTGNVVIQNAGTFTDSNYRLQVKAATTDSGSLLVSGSTVMSGSLTVTQGITGSLQGTAATASYYAGNAITSNGSTIYSVNPSTTDFPSFGSICIGSNAGYNASSAFYLVALGEQAGYQANAGFSTFIGYQAGYNATDASDTVAIGYQAGYQGVKSQYSVLIGDLTGRGATSASYSTYVGANAGNNALYASGSVFLGYNAGNGAASGSYSILLGYNAGWGNSFPNSSIGTNNIIIGNSITLAKDRRDSINIGGIIFGTGSYFSRDTNAMSSGSANGRIGINVVEPTAALDISGSLNLTFTGTGTGQALTLSGSNTVGGTSYFDFIKATNTSAGATNPAKSFRINGSNGDFEIINSAYTTNILTLTNAGVLTTPGGGTSDARVKTNIQYINTPTTDTIKQLKPVEFEFNSNLGVKRHGFIAQDVLQVKPNLVLGDGDKPDGTYGLDYDGILALTVKSLQEALARIEVLETEIKTLKG